MSFNDYLGPLVNMEGATSISIILLVDVDVGSFFLYIFVPIFWVKHIKTIIRKTPNLKNHSCSKFNFSHLLSLPRCPARRWASLPFGQLRSRTGSTSCCLVACWSNGQTMSSFHHRPPTVAELLLPLLVLRTCVPLSMVKVTNVII